MKLWDDCIKPMFDMHFDATDRFLSSVRDAYEAETGKRTEGWGDHEGDMIMYLWEGESEIYDTDRFLRALKEQSKRDYDYFLTLRKRIACPHLDYTDMLDGAKCNECGLESLFEWEDDEE